MYPRVSKSTSVLLAVVLPGDTRVFVNRPWSRNNMEQDPLFIFAEFGKNWGPSVTVPSPVFLVLSTLFTCQWGPGFREDKGV